MIAYQPARAVVDCLALPKGSGTYADALAAFGLQRLILLLAGQPFSLHDAGDCFTLRAARGGALDLDSVDYELVRRDAGYRYVRLPRDDSAAFSQEIDYSEERRKLLASRELANLIKRAKRQPTEEEREQLAQLAPMRNWSLYQNVNVLLGFGSYVGLHQEIRAADPSAFALAVRNRLAAAAIPALAALPGSGFAGKVTAVQVFNPTVGKGTSGVIPSGSGLAGLPGFFVDWFVEWLRYIGLGIAARSVALDKDVKVYVMAPGDLRPAAVGEVADDFRDVLPGYSSAKADVLLAIRLAQALVRRSGLGGGVDQIGIRQRRPSDIVSGLHVAFFKSLGQSRALANISFVGLPGWFPVNEETVNDWLAALEDHERVLRPLDEDRTEEANLLIRYRDFLSAGPEQVPALLQFLGAYALHVFRSREHGRPVAGLRIGVLSSLLRRLFMEQRPDLAPILEDVGFRHVAAAIRRATVSEQFFKANKQQEYEIHYGLLQDLQRKARFKDQFVAQLAEFITAYNTENARKAEQAGQSGRKGRRRAQVTTADVTAVIGLLDRFPTETVAMLLLAYASASDPRVTPAPAETSTEDELVTPGIEPDDAAV